MNHIFRKKNDFYRSNNQFPLFRVGQKNSNGNEKDLRRQVVRKFIPQQPSSIHKIEASVDKKIGLVNC